MKWNKRGQSILAALGCAGLGLALTSCGQSNTVDYLYLTSAKTAPGEIDVYRVDSQSGALTQIPDSPYSSVGNNPVGLVASPNGSYLYVINHDTNTIVQFGIGTDAKLYSDNSYNTPGTEPVAIGINQAGTFLFVVDYYAPGFTDANTGPGALAVYPINKDGSLGAAVTQTQNGVSQNYWTIGTVPTAINVINNQTYPSGNASGTGNYIYVADQLNGATCTGAGGNSGVTGAIRGFYVNSSGVVTPTSGSPYCGGTTPSAIASHPLSTYLYAVDSTQNDIVGYTIDTGSDSATPGALTAFPVGTIATGVGPSAITVEPRGLYMYVTNRTAGTIQSYSIAAGTGVPATSGTVTTDPYPQCIIVEPALARFVYTADYDGLGITGYQLNPSTGILSGDENSPYPGSGLNTCLAAVVHGNHPSVQIQATASTN